MGKMGGKMSWEDLYGRFSFRAWDEEMKHYVGWDEIQQEWEELGYFDAIFREDHYKCEQCTGFKDENEKFIYEGDLIRCKNNSCLLEVIWEDGAWQTKEYRENGLHELPLSELVSGYGVSVISNIHRVPKVLKDE